MPAKRKSTRCPKGCVKKPKSRKTGKVPPHLKAWMDALRKAKKNNLTTFKYKNNTYIKKICKSGMIVYKLKSK